MNIDYYSIVEVLDCPEARADSLVGEHGTVLGMAHRDDGSAISYGLGFSGRDEVIIIPADFVRATGDSAEPSDWMSGQSIRVRPNGHVGGSSSFGET